MAIFQPQKLYIHWFGQGASPFSLPTRLALRMLGLAYRLALALYRGLFAPLMGARTKEGVRVIAIGNLVAGGAGKTPCAMALARLLSASGIDVGILSRGYKSRAQDLGPTLIDQSLLSTVTPKDVGDEPWLMAWRTGVPVVSAKDRWAGLGLLLSRHPEISVVILDDGLSQRRLQWDQSLLLIDERGFGNGLCLPDGPLREPIGDLRRFNAWVDNGYGAHADQADRRHLPDNLPRGKITMTHSPAGWIALERWNAQDNMLGFDQGLLAFRAKTILAVAAIAVPGRFFSLLKGHGLAIEEFSLPDHEPMLAEKLSDYLQGKNFDVIVMTEKDAVKFFHRPPSLQADCYALRMDTVLSGDFLKELTDGPQAD